MTDPFLSIIIAARNDNYGGDFIQRLQQCIDWNAALLAKNEISSEFVIVNWNPVAENKPLKQLLKFPENLNGITFRIITAEHEIHKHYVNPELRQTVPLFEFIAKNAGIRKAKGEYILCINADILIHPEVFEFIAARKMNDRNYYRANRFDYKNNSAVSLSEFYNAGYAVSLKGFLYLLNSPVDKNLHYQVLKLFNPFRLNWEFWKKKNEKVSNFLGLSVTRDNAAYYAHCLNSGDFMLMHRNNWFELKGYPEYTRISTHTDALFTIFAFSKWKEFVFEAPVFHREHERRYTWEAIKNENVFLEAFKKFETIAQQVISGEKVEQFLNDESWGCSDFTVEESEL